MTNGEKMQEMFPEGKIRRCRGGVVFESDGWCHAYDSDWWNTEHKEPTTKNVLAVDKEQLKTMIRGLTKWYVKRDSTEIGEPNTAVGLLYDDVMFGIDRLSPATPQKPKIVPIAEIKYDEDKLKELVNKAVLTVAPQEPRWIPVSEKTPEHGGEYLLWGKICDDDDEEYCFLGDYYEFEEKFGIENGIYDPHTLGFLGTEIDEYYSVIAWMPLPKPYKAESEDKE